MASIPACHAVDRGLIPHHGGLFCPAPLPLRHCCTVHYHVVPSITIAVAPSIAIIAVAPSITIVPSINNAVALLSRLSLPLRCRCATHCHCCGVAIVPSIAVAIVCLNRLDKFWQSPINMKKMTSDPAAKKRVLDVP